MKIYFCDLCNESIPLEDLKEGKASTIKGKIFCRGCNPLNTVESSTPRSGAGVMLPIALFVVAAGLAGGAWFFAYQLMLRIDEVPRHDDALARLETRLDRAVQDLESIGGSHKDLSGDLAKLRDGHQELRTSGSDHVHRITQAEQDVVKLSTLLGELRSDREVLEAIEVQQDDFRSSLAGVRENVASLEGRLSGMTVGVRPVTDVTETDDPAEPEFDASVRELLADLESRDASVRWAAVDQLDRERDAALIPHLIPLLDDSDAFVQFRVISTLRNLNARSAVKKLIDLLRDADAIVREEALEALVTLTGNPLRFDVANGSAADREKGARGWEEWYSKNRERFAVDG